MVGLHLSAIVAYAVFQQNDLISPMVSGQKLVKHAEANDRLNVLRFLVCAALGIGVAVWVAYGAMPFG